MDYDPEKVAFGNVVLHIVDWSLKTPLNAAAIKNLKPPVYKAIDKAVEEHMKRVTEGNAPPLSASSGSAISASVA